MHPETVSLPTAGSLAILYNYNKNDITDVGQANGKVMKINPFYKYLTKEDHLHLQIVQYLNLQYKDSFWIHCPSEGRRTPFERYKAKLLGLKKGIIDFLIFEKRIYAGLAIEIKIKPNKPTSEQLETMEKLQNRGWWTTVCYTFEQAKNIIDWYLNLKN